jgi:DNA polymerase III alpha subunit (gram-positive type)
MSFPVLFFLDFETSGLDCARHGIIQAGWIVEKNGTILSEQGFDVQLYRGCDINPVALEINDFTIERCMAGKPLEVMTAALRGALAAGFTSKIVPIGHRISFDLGFFREACEKTRDNLAIFVDFHKQVDTLGLAQWLNHTGYIHTKDNKLETLCDYYGIKIEAHDALSDVRAVRQLYHIFMEIMRKLPENENEKKRSCRV